MSLDLDLSTTLRDQLADLELESFSTGYSSTLASISESGVQELDRLFSVQEQMADIMTYASTTHFMMQVSPRPEFVFDTDTSSYKSGFPSPLYPPMIPGSRSCSICPTGQGRSHRQHHCRLLSSKFRDAGKYNDICSGCFFPRLAHPNGSAQWGSSCPSPLNTLVPEFALFIGRHPGRHLNKLISGGLLLASHLRNDLNTDSDIECFSRWLRRDKKKFFFLAVLL